MIVGILIGLGLVLALVTLVNTTIDEKMGVEGANESLYKADSPWNYRIDKLSFYQDTIMDIQGTSWNELCPTAEEDTIIITLAVSVKDAPNQCQFFVDQFLAKRITDLTPPCYPNCGVDEMFNTMELGRGSVKQEHLIRICCDDLCSEKLLRNPCG